MDHAAHSHDDGHGDHGHDGHGHDHHDHGDHEQHGSLSVYLAIFVALLVLTAMSFTIGNIEAFRATPAVMWTAMMAISCVKALCVMLGFMHLYWEANWKYILTIPASCMSLFLVVMLIPDVGQRTRYYSSERWQYAPIEKPHSDAKHGTHETAPTHEAKPAIAH